jgi:hypothetical protein
VVGEETAGVGELQAAPDLGEQLGPDRPFEGGHLLGHRAGRVAEGRRGRRHAAGLPDLDQGAQLDQVEAGVHAGTLNGGVDEPWMVLHAAGQHDRSAPGVRSRSPRGP